MRNRLHNVLGGRVRHTCTICSFPGYLLPRVKNETEGVFLLSLLTLLSPKCWDFPIFMLTDYADDRQPTDKPIALPLAAHALTRGKKSWGATGGLPFKGNTTLHYRGDCIPTSNWGIATYVVNAEVWRQIWVQSRGHAWAVRYWSQVMGGIIIIVIIIVQVPIYMCTVPPQTHFHQ